MMQPVEAMLLIGPTGSGKSPLGSYVEEQGIAGRRCRHFDFGHQLRTIAQLDYPPEAFSRQEHQFVRDVLDKGLLLEDEHFPVAEKIVRIFLDHRGNHETDLLILNGLPRHVGQARDMENLVNVTRVLVLECAAGAVCERIEKNTGGDRSGRMDDATEMIRKKLEIYCRRTAPLIAYYSGRGSRLITVEVGADSTTETLFAGLVSGFNA